MVDIDDGYTRIANELLEAIMQHPFTKRELNIVLAVIRTTYGYQRKVDAVSIWQLSNMTKIDRSHVSKSVADLKEKNVILEANGGRISHGVEVKSIGLNKNYKSWTTDAKTATVAKTAQVLNQLHDRCQNGPPTDAKTAHTERKTKEKKEKALPSFIDVQLWAEFKKFRKEIKSPLTETAESRALSKLERLHGEGQDVALVIEQSIENGWKGLFPVKGGSQKQPQQKFIGAI